LNISSNPQYLDTTLSEIPDIYPRMNTRQSERKTPNPNEHDKLSADMIEYKFNKTSSKIWAQTPA
jgi:hypothetical protein